MVHSNNYTIVCIVKMECRLLVIGFIDTQNTYMWKFITLLMECEGDNGSCWTLVKQIQYTINKKKSCVCLFVVSTGYATTFQNHFQRSFLSIEVSMHCVCVNTKHQK